MIKKMIAAVLSAVIISLSFCGNIFAAGAAADEAVRFLTELGIITSEIDNFDRAISREEFAVYAAKMLRLEEEDTSATRYFKDVEPYSYAAGAINALVKQGILSVPDNREFRPQESITFAETCKILVTAIGYEADANRSGGYPSGYLSMAVRLDITRNVQAKDTVSYQDAFRMMYQTMLDAPLRVISSVDAQGNVLEYKEDDEDRLLTAVWDLYSASGMVTAVYGQTTGEKIVKQENQLYLNHELYFLADSVNADGHFGDYVKVYYKAESEDDDRVIVAIQSKSKEETVYIDPENFLDVNASEISFYDEDGHRQKLELDAPAFVYNGAVLKTGLKDTFTNINKGEIAVKDGNGDGVYDTVVVRDYSNFLVSSVSTGKIYDQLGSEPICPADYDSFLVYSASGTRLDETDIQAGQILSVARSADGSSLAVIISESEVSGTVSEIEKIGNVYYLVINSQKYAVDKSYAEKIATTYLSALSPTDNFLFKMDSFGNIAYMTKQASTLQTGYVIGGEIKSGSIAGNVQIKLLTKNNKFEIFQLADNVKINNREYREADRAFSEIPGAKNDNGAISLEPQLVRYMLNENNEIIRMQTASFNAWTNGSGAGINMIYETVAAQWYNSGRLGAKATLTNNTEIFFIPYGATDLEEDDCMIVAYSDLINDVNYNCNAYLFTEDSIFADAVVCYYKPEDLYNNLAQYKPLIMVSNITKKLNSEGDTQTCITGYSRGSKVEYLIPEEISFSGVEEGDLIMFDYDVHGNVIEGAGDKNYVIVCKRSDIYENNKPNWTANSHHDYLYSESNDAGTDYYRAVFQLSYGFVSDVNGTAVAWDRDSDGLFDETANITGNIVIYDSGRRDKSHIYIGTAADLITQKTAGANCAKIIYRTRAGAPWETFIYQ